MKLPLEGLMHPILGSQLGTDLPASSHPKRILMVCQRFLPQRWAGAECQALSLARALQRQGHRPEFLTTQARGHEGPPDGETYAGVRVHRLTLAPGPALSLRRALAVMRWLQSRLRDYDLLHVHCVSAAGLAALAVAQRHDLPTVCKPSLGGPRGELAAVRQSRLHPWLTRILRRVDRHVALDSTIEDELLGLEVSPSRITRVDNGVDLQQFRPGPIGASRPTERAPTVLFVGQLEARKGLLELLSAWPHVMERFPDAKLCIVGQGSLAPELRSRLARPDWHLEWHPRHERVDELMREANLFVLPSHNESFGNVVVEALACATPVVTGSTGIAPRLKLQGSFGRVVSITPGALAEAITSLLGSQDPPPSGAEFREKIAAFDIDTVAQHYDRLYQQLLSSAPRPASLMPCPDLRSTS